MRARTSRRNLAGDRAATTSSPPRPLDPALARERRRPARRSSGGTGSISQRQRHRQVLLDGRAFEQHASRADDPEPIEPREPFLAVRRCRTVSWPKTRTSPSSGRLAPVIEIDQHLRGAGIEAADGDALAGRNRQLLQAQRTQALVALRDAGDLEDGGHARGSPSLPSRRGPAVAPRARRNLRRASVTDPDDADPSRDRARRGSRSRPTPPDRACRASPR